MLYQIYSLFYKLNPNFSRYLHNHHSDSIYFLYIWLYIFIKIFEHDLIYEIKT